MAFFHNLECKRRTLRHHNLEITGHVGLVRFTGTLYHTAVEQDIRVSHRHRRVLIKHATGEHHCRDIIEIDILHYTVVLIERDGCGRRTGVVEVVFCRLRNRRHAIGRLFTVPERVVQAIEEEGSRLIGVSNDIIDARCRENYFRTIATGTVLKLHTTGDATER